MILDYDNEFTTKDGQAVTADAIGTKVLDAGAAKDWGAGEPLVAYARITADAASNPTTSETVDIIGADNALLTTNPVVLATVTIAAAAALASTVHRVGILRPGLKKRYLGCKFTNTGGAPTTGKWIVGLAPFRGTPQDGVNAL